MGDICGNGKYWLTFSVLKLADNHPLCQLGVFPSIHLSVCIRNALYLDSRLSILAVARRGFIWPSYWGEDVVNGLSNEQIQVSCSG